MFSAIAGAMAGRRVVDGLRIVLGYRSNEEPSPSVTALPFPYQRDGHPR
jgi:hypothetical protein